MTTEPNKRTGDATREALLPFQPVGRQFTAYSGLAFQWSRAGNRWRLKSGRTVADVVPDEHYAGMYRVKLSGEPATDMVNLTRARDAAIALVGRAATKQAKMAAMAMAA